MLEGKKSVSSWKEKNVTLKEKHLHGKTKLYFSYVLQLCFRAMFYKTFTKKYKYQMRLS
jgi:hypothetical protein